jgi:hypothetical protein
VLLAWLTALAESLQETYDQERSSDMFASLPFHYLEIAALVLHKYVCVCLHVCGA